jgi:two-component system cell cycle response regulator DivK
MPKTILIVEDNAMNMKLFSALLEKRGHRTIYAHDGMTALALAREHRPDLILMDVQLPDVSGLEVTGWIRQDPAISHTTIIAVTALAMKGDGERILLAGCDAYIPMPITIPEFLGVIENMLGEGWLSL